MGDSGSEILSKAKYAERMAEEYLLRESGDHCENINQAIGLMEDVLTMLDEEMHTRAWVSLSTKLGIFYLRRCNGDKEKNGAMALAYFENVEKYFGRDFRWGKLQESIGRAYLMQGPEYINMAIDAFESSLDVIRKDEYPAFWIGLRINLAKAYAAKSGHINTRNAFGYIEEAISALEEYALPGSDYYYASINKIRGDLHIKDAGRQGLPAAIEMYRKSIRTFPREVFPVEYEEVMKALLRSERMLGNDPWTEFSV